MKKWLVSFIILTINIVYAQTVYVDPATTVALAGYATVLKDTQEDIIEKQSELKDMQLWLGGQLYLLDDTQKRLLKGLREVNGTITNGYQILKIVKGCNRIRVLTQKLYDEISEHPEYAVFAVGAKNYLFQQVTFLISELTEITRNGEDNLMTSGDRYRMLDRIYNRVSRVKLAVYKLLGVIRRAKRIGFWRSANPFQGYIDKDKDIIENIIQRYDRLIN